MSTTIALVIAGIAVLIALPICYWYGRRDLEKRKAREFADAVEIYITVRENHG